MPPGFSPPRGGLTPGAGAILGPDPFWAARGRDGLNHLGEFPVLEDAGQGQEGDDPVFLFDPGPPTRA